MVRGRPAKKAPAAGPAAVGKGDWFLEERGLYAAGTTGDGNCMFRGLSVALFGTEDRHMELRLATCDELVRRVGELVCFAPEEEECGRRRRGSRGSSLDTAEGRFLARAERMRRSGTWANELELMAFASAHGVHVTVWRRPAPKDRQHTRDSLRTPMEYGPEDAARSACLLFDEGCAHYQVLRNLAGPHEGRPECRPLPLHRERGGTAGKEEGAASRDEDALSAKSCGTKRSSSDREDNAGDDKDEPARKKSKSSSPAPARGSSAADEAVATPAPPAVAGTVPTDNDNTVGNNDSASKSSSTIDAAVTSSSPSAPAAIDEKAGAECPVEVGRPRRSSSSSGTSQSSKRSFSQRDDEGGDEEAQGTGSRPVKSPRLDASTSAAATTAKNSGSPSPVKAARSSGLTEDSEGESEPDFDAFERDVKFRDAAARAQRKGAAAAKKAARLQRAAGVARKPVAPGPSSKEEEEADAGAASAEASRTSSAVTPEAVASAGDSRPETDSSAATRSVLKGSDDLGTQRRSRASRKPPSPTIKRVTKSKSSSVKRRTDRRRLVEEREKGDEEEEEVEGKKKVSSGDRKEKGTGRGKADSLPMKKRRTPRSKG